MQKIIIIETKALKGAVNAITAGKVCELKSTLPILACVLLTATAAGVTIEATNLDVEAATDLPGEGPEGAQLAIDAKALKAALGKVKAERVTFTDLGGERVAMAAEDGTGATIKLAARSPGDWPRMVYRPGEGTAWAVPAEELGADLARLSPAISTEETRYYLNGVLIHAVEEQGGAMRYRMAATDGHRLARIDRPAPEGFAAVRDMIVPRLTVAFIQRALGKAPAGTVQFEATASKIDLTAGAWRIRSKLVDGTFPDYSRVIPSYNENRVTIRPGDLAAEIDAVTAHVSDRVRAVNVTAGEGWATVWANDVDNGACGAVVDCAELATAEPVWFGVNARYLRTALESFGDAEAVTLHIHDASAPLRFDCTETPEFLTVLMPMRTDRGEVTPADIKALTMTPVDKLQQQAPADVLVIRGEDFSPEAKRSAARHLGGLVRDAVAHIATPGDRRAARLAVAVMVEEIEGVPGKATREIEHQPKGGGFAGWAARAAEIEARAAARPRPVSPVPVAAPEAGGEAEELRKALQAAETRARRLAAVLAGRKRQLAVVGEALVISRERTARLTRQVATSGVSLSAMAAVG
jgi:DNA polymerase-3 subunit beta